MTIVDASVAVDWVAPDADPSGPARSWLRRLAEEGVALRRLSGLPYVVDLQNV